MNGDEGGTLQGSRTALRNTENYYAIDVPGHFGAMLRIPILFRLTHHDYTKYSFPRM